MIGDQAGDLSTLVSWIAGCPRKILSMKSDVALTLLSHGIDSARLFIAAGALGMTQCCLDASIKFAKERWQFGKPIGSFQMIQDTIATMAAELMAVRWQVYYAADLKSKNLPHAKELSAAKMLAGDLAVRAARASHSCSRSLWLHR